jgi:hypothetical protein
LPEILGSLGVQPDLERIEVRLGLGLPDLNAVIWSDPRASCSTA